MAIDYPINPAALQSAKIKGYDTNNKRPLSLELQIVSVWDKEGNEHRVQRHVANDYVNIRGWSRTQPAPVVTLDEAGEPAVDTSANPVDTVTAPTAAGDDHTPPSEIELAPVFLETLRAQATELGIKVDSRWGKRRLEDEIKAAKK